MEFDIEKNKVVGVADLQISEDHLRIKMFGYFDNALNYKEFDNESIKRYFPPDGYIFERNFFRNSKFGSIHLGDLMEFKVYKNIKAKDGFDEYRINNNSTARKIGHKIVELRGLIIENQVVRLDEVSFGEDNLGDFYAVYGNKIIGKLRNQNGKIIPAKFKRLYQWSIEKCNIIRHHTELFLVTENKEKELVLDAMNNDQLFDWFRRKLKELNETVVDDLDKKTKWRNRVPEILDQYDSDLYDLENLRLNRLNKIFHYYELSVSEIKDLIDSSPTLREAFLKTIDLQKHEFRQEYQNEFDSIKKQISLAEVSLLEKRENSERLENKIQSQSKELDEIKSSKERILSDFSIIKDVLGSAIPKSESLQNDSFIIETILPGDDTLLINKKDQFLDRLKKFLVKFKISTSIAPTVSAATATFRGTFIGDERIGIALIEATGNARYIIQQVEPDWLHFKDFWDNGLEAIWKSSHENPDLLHFLILEDINLSSPECYMRPLLDCMNGIRKRIPYALNGYPENLKVLATKISSDVPKIGLPLYEQTFKNWGAVGFAEQINKDSEQKHSAVEGYINSITLSNFKLDEFDLKTDSLALSSQFRNLFDRPE